MDTHAVEDKDVDEVDMDVAVVRRIPRYALSAYAYATVLIYHNQENATTAPAPAPAAPVAPEENPNQNQRGQKVPFPMTPLDFPF